MTKYLKQWTGVTSGSYAGRDDGYPETKYRVYDSIDELAKDFGKQREEVYFKLTAVDKAELKKLTKESLEKQVVEEKKKKKQKITDEISKLQKELRDLN